VIEDCQKNNFAGYYPSPESIELFDRLYTNKTGLTDKFVNYWKVVAQRFSGNPYVVGYDPLNEPFPGRILTDPSMFLEVGKFDKVSLQPLYERTFNEAY